jgi:hypothetical protein
MARLYPTLMVVPMLLAACATSAPVSSPYEAAYLEGRTSDYSIRVDELEMEGFQKLCKELPKALVAGNQDMTVAASMFRRGDYVTLDLVVHNHGHAPLELHRADVYILDYMGNRLEPVADWEGAERYGLRSKIAESTEYAYLEGLENAPRVYGAGEAGSGNTNKGQGLRPAGSTPPPSDPGTELDMLLEPVTLRKNLVTAPETLVLQPEQKRPWWVYYRASEVVFPLSAIVRVDGKRLIFRFEEPRA